LHPEANHHGGGEANESEGRCDDFGRNC
jgi:hypothetical protein